MQILSQFANPSPRHVSSTRRILRIVLQMTLLAFGCYAIYRGEKNGRAEAAQLEAEYKARHEALEKETEAYLENAADEMTEIYRGLNTIFAYAGLDPIGEGS